MSKRSEGKRILGVAALFFVISSAYESKLKLSSGVFTQKTRENLPDVPILD